MKTAKIKWQHGNEIQLQRWMSQGVSFLETERGSYRIKREKKGTYRPWAASNVRVLGCITDGFAVSLWTQWGAFPTLFTTFQNCQMDFLTSHVIKAKGSGYRLFMLMDFLTGWENLLCSLYHITASKIPHYQRAEQHMPGSLQAALFYYWRENLWLVCFLLVWEHVLCLTTPLYLSPDSLFLIRSMGHSASVIDWAVKFWGHCTVRSSWSVSSAEVTQMGTEGLWNLTPTHLPTLPLSVIQPPLGLLAVY